VNDGAFDETFRQGVGVEVNPDLHGVASHKHGIVICDVVGFAVRDAKPKRLEWLRIHALLEFYGAYDHGVNLSFLISEIKGP
jgi:hypothetical protein